MMSTGLAHGQRPMVVALSERASVLWFSSFQIEGGTSFTLLIFLNIEIWVGANGL